MQGQGMQQAVVWFRLSADQGHADAPCHLGMMYGLHIPFTTPKFVYQSTLGLVQPFENLTEAV